MVLNNRIVGYILIVVGILSWVALDYLKIGIAPATFLIGLSAGLIAGIAGFLD